MPAPITAATSLRLLGRYELSATGLRETYREHLREGVVVAEHLLEQLERVHVLVEAARGTSRAAAVETAA
jgi:hypothetical protein